MGESPIDFKLQFGVKNRMLILAMSGRQLSGILGLTRIRLHTKLTSLISEAWKSARGVRSSTYMAIP